MKSPLAAPVIDTSLSSPSLRPIILALPLAFNPKTLCVAFAPGMISVDADCSCTAPLNNVEPLNLRLVVVSKEIVAAATLI